MKTGSNGDLRERTKSLNPDLLSREIKKRFWKRWKNPFRIKTLSALSS